MKSGLLRLPMSHPLTIYLIFFLLSIGLHFILTGSSDPCKEYRPGNLLTQQPGQGPC